MVDRGLISEFERSLSSQEGPVWFPVGAYKLATNIPGRGSYKANIARTNLHC